MRVAVALAAAAAVAGCAPALRKPPPQPGAEGGAAVEGGTSGARGPGPTADELLSLARAQWARRPDKAAVREAERLYLASASADARGTAGLVGVVYANAWLSEREANGDARAALASAAVDAGQWCEQRAPGTAACSYALAIALGLQARERRATAMEGLKLMVERLRSAIALDPRLDRGGPHRVLAQVLARAPGWPAGPGDVEQAVVEARAAVALFPEHPPNVLALALALSKDGKADEARVAAERAVQLARKAVDEPDAPDWIQEGQRLRAQAAGGS